MRRQPLLIDGVSLGVFLLFFFFVPVVWMNIIPCFSLGHGFSSLSYYLFNAGETYLNGHLVWMTESYANCI